MIKLKKTFYELSHSDKAILSKVLKVGTAPNGSIAPILNENVKIRDYLKHSSRCKCFFVDKEAFKDLESFIHSLSEGIKNQKTDNENSEYRAAIGLIPEFLSNYVLGCKSINATPHSYSESVKYQLDSGHFMGRLETKGSKLTSVTGHQKNGYRFSKGELVFSPANTDEIIVSIESLTNIPGIDEYYSNCSDYVLVIFHGVMTTNSFNHHVKNGNCTPVKHENSKKVYLCENIYKELIGVDEYISKYLYRMSSPLHILNGIGNKNFLRLMNTYLYYFFKSLHIPYTVSSIEPLMGINNELIKSLEELYKSSYDRFRKSSTSFRLYQSTIIRFACPYKEMGNLNMKNKISFIDIEISKTNKKPEGRAVIKSMFEKEIPDFSNCDEDTVENFIRDNFTKYPIVGYGIRGIFGEALKNYSRNCIDGKTVQHTVCFLDLDDMLNVFSVYNNDILTKKYKETQLDSFYFYDWTCMDMLNVIPNSILEDCLKLTKKEIMEDMKHLVNNITRILSNGGISADNTDSKDILRIVPLFYMFYLLTHIFTSSKFPKEFKNSLDLYNPSYILEPNGLYDYSKDIDNYVKTGMLPLITFEKENVVSYNYKPSKVYHIDDKITTKKNKSEEIKEKLDALAEKQKENEDVKPFGEGSQEFIGHMDKQEYEYSSFRDPSSPDLSHLHQTGPVDAYDMKSEDVYNTPVEDADISVEALDSLRKCDDEKAVEYIDMPDSEKQSEQISFGENVENPIGVGEMVNEVKEFDVNSMGEEENQTNISTVQSSNNPYLNDFFDKELAFTEAQIRVYMQRNAVTLEEFRGEISKKILEMKDLPSLFQIFNIIMQ